MGKLILYFTLGYPDNDTLLSFIDSIEPGTVDYIEFGFPSENPKNDGPVKRSKHSTAIKNREPEKYEEIFRKAAEKVSRLYSLSYYSDVKDKFNSFISYLKEHSFSGIILPDLLIDYFPDADKVIEEIHSYGLDFIPFFTPASPDRIITAIAGRTRSWIYYGLQPSTGINVPYDLDEVADRIKILLPGREINFGFGIRDSSQIEGLMERGASGTAIGSLLVKMLETGDIARFSDFIKQAGGVLNE